MDNLDEKLRQKLLEPAGRRFACIGAGIAVLLFFVLGLAGRLAIPADEAGRLLPSVLLLTLPMALAAAFASDASLRSGLSRLGTVMILLAALAAMAARMAFLPHVSSDYEQYLSPWIAQLSGGSFREAMTRQISEYNVLYQYLLRLVGRLPVPDLVGVKALSLIGDALLAGGLAHLAAKKRSAVAFGMALLLPTILLNGAMFAQCDSLYAAAAIWGLALALDGRPALSAGCFALSLAFKLQAVFFFPLLPVLWADYRLRLRDIPVFAGTLAVLAVPAVLGGKSPAAILAYYTGQTGLYTGLTYNAPTLFGLVNTQGLDVYAYGRFGVLLAGGACLVTLLRGTERAGRMKRVDHVRLALLTVLTVVFLLPRMHERYFYLASALSLVMAAESRRFILPCALLEAACFSRLWEMGIPLPAASAMVLAAILLAAIPERRGAERYDC